MKRCIGSAKHHRTVFRFFERYYDAKEVIHKRISWSPENISKSGPKIRPKIKKIECSMKRCIGSAKHLRTVFRFFERYYDAKEVIHEAFPEIQKISQNLGPKLGQKLKKLNLQWKGASDPQNITEPFLAFRKILRCWRSDSSAHFQKSRKYIKIWAQN